MSIVNEIEDAILRAEGHEWRWDDALMDTGPTQCWCVLCRRKRDISSLLHPDASPPLPERCPAK